MELPTMIYSIICVFVLLINKVSLQAENVAVGVSGGSVVLPCATSEIEPKLSNIIVQWRHNNSLNVYDIIEGKFYIGLQDFNYQNRTETFPTEYEKGNFSLKLKNLTHADGGNYQCYILHLEEQVTLIIQLIINESTVQTGEQPTEDNGNQARKTHLWMILTLVFSVFILICIVLCIFIRKKRCKTPKSGLSERPRDDDLELYEKFNSA